MDLPFWGTGPSSTVPIECLTISQNCPCLFGGLPVANSFPTCLFQILPPLSLLLTNSAQNVLPLPGSLPRLLPLFYQLNRARELLPKSPNTCPCYFKTCYLQGRAPDIST